MAGEMRATVGEGVTARLPLGLTGAARRCTGASLTGVRRERNDESERRRRRRSSERAGPTCGLAGAKRGWKTAAPRTGAGSADVVLMRERRVAMRRMAKGEGACERVEGVVVKSILCLSCVGAGADRLAGARGDENVEV